MRSGKRLLLIGLVLFSCVGCDQVTKNIARQNLSHSGPLPFFGNLFRLQYTENPGAFLGMGAGSTETLRFWLFVILVGVFLVGLLIHLLVSSQNSKPQTVALALVVGGGISNLIDRIINGGRVIDFMNVGIGSLRTGIFNVADLAITFGVVWFLAVTVKRKKTPIAG